MGAGRGSPCAHLPYLACVRRVDGTGQLAGAVQPSGIQRDATGRAHRNRPDQSDAVLTMEDECEDWVWAVNALQALPKNAVYWFVRFSLIPPDCTLNTCSGCEPQIAVYVLN